MQNKLNINDWSSVQSLFDKLNKQMEKTLKAADSLGAPRVYIKMLVELEVQCYNHIPAPCFAVTGNKMDSSCASWTLSYSAGAIACCYAWAEKPSKPRCRS